MESYESKAIITKITATSRASVKIRENYYTLEFTEEHTIPQVEGVDIEAERALLWDIVNTEVDNQVQSTFDALRNNRYIWLTDLFSYVTMYLD